MFLDDFEKIALDSLGLKITNGKFVSSQGKFASSNSYLDCGLDVYIDLDTGSTYEKIAGELIPQDSLEIQAEKRFLRRHLKK